MIVLNRIRKCNLNFDHQLPMYAEIGNDIENTISTKVDFKVCVVYDLKFLLSMYISSEN